MAIFAVLPLVRPRDVSGPKPESITDFYTYRGRVYAVIAVDGRHPQVLLTDPITCHVGDVLDVVETRSLIGYTAVQDPASRCRPGLGLSGGSPTARSRGY